MTIPYRPRQIVAGPSFTPLPFGLLSSLSTEIRSPADAHWEGGVTYETLCGASATTYDECLTVSGTGDTVVRTGGILMQGVEIIQGVAQPPAPPPDNKAETTAWLTRGATPFTVYSEVDCSAPGFWDRAEDSVLTALTQSEQRAVEEAFWTGVANSTDVVHPHLASDEEIVEGTSGIILDTAATIVSGGTIEVALGYLEDALADCYDGVGVIHVPRRLAPALANINSLKQVGSRYITPNGNVIIFGSGYPGTGPSGEAGTWMFATGWPFIYRGPVRLFLPRESINRTENTVHMIAERTYVIGWDCCHLATQVTFGT